MFDAIEEPFDAVALAIDPATEGEGLLAIGFGRDIRLGFTLFGEAADGIRIVCAISQKRRTGPKVTQKLLGHWRVSRLACRQFHSNRPAFSVDQRMDLGRQAATRTSHARIVNAPFFALAPCW